MTVRFKTESIVIVLFYLSRGFDAKTMNDVIFSIDGKEDHGIKSMMNKVRALGIEDGEHGTSFYTPGKGGHNSTLDPHRTDRFLQRLLRKEKELESENSAKKEVGEIVMLRGKQVAILQNSDPLRWEDLVKRKPELASLIRTPLEYAGFLWYCANEIPLEDIAALLHRRVRNLNSLKRTPEELEKWLELVAKIRPAVYDPDRARKWDLRQTVILIANLMGTQALFEQFLKSVELTDEQRIKWHPKLDTNISWNPAYLSIAGDSSLSGPPVTSEETLGIMTATAGPTSNPYPSSSSYPGRNGKGKEREH